MAESCDTPDLGRIKAVAMFLLDDCMAPIWGTSAGFIDSCPANVETTDNMDEGVPWLKRCPDGTIRRFLPGKKSLQSILVNMDFNWIDPEWVALAGGAEPVVHNGEIIGWGDATRSNFNVLFVVWQEILGGDVCTDENLCDDYVRLYPVKDARMTEFGTIGSADNVIRVTGETVAAHQLGSGPIPLACDGVTGDPEWLSNCLPSGVHRFRFVGGHAPLVGDDVACGPYDTEEPPVPCTPGS